MLNHQSSPNDWYTDHNSSRDGMHGFHIWLINLPLRTRFFAQVLGHGRYQSTGPTQPWAVVHSRHTLRKYTLWNPLAMPIGSYYLLGLSQKSQHGIQKTFQLGHKASMRTVHSLRKRNGIRYQDTIMKDYCTSDFVTKVGISSQCTYSRTASCKPHNLNLCIMVGPLWQTDVVYLALFLSVPHLLSLYCSRSLTQTGQP